MKNFIIQTAKQVKQWFYPSQYELREEESAFNSLLRMSKDDEPSKYKAAFDVCKRRMARYDCTINRQNLYEYGVLGDRPFTGCKGEISELGNCPRCFGVIDVGYNCQKCEKEYPSFVDYGVAFVIPIYEEDRFAYWNPFFLSNLLSLEDDILGESLLPGRVETDPIVKAILGNHDFFEIKLRRHFSDEDENFLALVEYDRDIVKAITGWKEDTQVSGKVALALKNIIHGPQMQEAIKMGKVPPEDGQQETN